MKKRRTRKQKATANHEFTIRWNPTASETKTEPVKDKIEASVKGQFNIEPKKPNPSSHKHESAMNLAKDGSLASIKKDIVKSLMVVSLILALEVVLYLAWYA